MSYAYLFKYIIIGDTGTCLLQQQQQQVLCEVGQGPFRCRYEHPLVVKRGVVSSSVPERPSSLGAPKQNVRRHTIRLRHNDDVFHGASPCHIDLSID